MLRRFVLTMLLFVSIGVALGAGTPTQPATQPLDENGLPGPQTLALEQQRAGNPLANYVELVRREKEYAKSEMWQQLYYDIRGTRASFLGDQREAQAMYDRFEGGYQTGDVTSSPLDQMKPTDAAEYILSIADKHQIIMLSERHHVPQTRVLSAQLLQGLWDKGFRYLAMETFDNDKPGVEADMNARDYPKREDGFYTQEPVLGDVVRQAQRMGFTLVAYEDNESFKLPHDPENPNKRQNVREMNQARHIKAKILDKDPEAKVFVHAGMGHASKGGGKGLGEKGDPWVPMAKAFWEITGIEPYTIDLQSNVYERSDRTKELGLFRYVNDKGWVMGPTVFVDGNGAAYTMLPGSYDVTVFLPRVKYESGRPDWLSTALGRTPTRIPPELLMGNGIRLVQAFYEDEPDDAVPADQILVKPGDEVPVLMLPKGSFRLRTWDETGRVVASSKIKA